MAYFSFLSAWIQKLRNSPCLLLLAYLFRYKLFERLKFDIMHTKKSCVANGKYSGRKPPPPPGGALIQGSPKKTRGKLKSCSLHYWREAPKCSFTKKCILFCYLEWWNCLFSVIYDIKLSLNSKLWNYITIWR